MNKMIVAMLFALTANMAFVSAPSAAAPMSSPEGVWELEYRDSHFKVNLCEGDRLCAVLVWLSEGASTPEKTKYLNKPLVDRAKRVGDRSWAGDLDILGWHTRGRVTQVSDDVIDLQGCVLILCKTFKLYRLKD